MKKQAKTLFVCLALLVMGANLSAQQIFPLSSSTGYGSARSTGSHYYSSTGDLFTELILDLITGVWFVNNALVTFEPYPYAAEGKYLVFGDLNAESNFSSSYISEGQELEATEEAEPVKTRVFRFAADTGMFWMNGLSVGNETRFEGYLFKFIGPIVENTLYCKTPEQFGQNGNDAGNLRLGAEFAIFQTNMLSGAFFIEWDHWYGSLKADGVALGLIARSYPIKPLMIEWRGMVHDFNKNEQDICIWESILEVGFMAWRNIEVFASWRHLDAMECPYFFEGSRSDGVTAGVRVHF